LRSSVAGTKSIESVESSWFIRLSVKDEPGVLASIAGLFGEQNVSIESVIQEGRGDNAELVLVTHEATEENLTTAINDIANLESVSSVTSTIRVYS
jgi:homoserine dehydrogenase